MTGGVLVVVLFVVFAWLLLFHSPRLVLRWACWVLAWAVVRIEAQEMQQRLYQSLTERLQRE